MQQRAMRNTKNIALALLRSLIALALAPAEVRALTDTLLSVLYHRGLQCAHVQLLTQPPTLLPQRRRHGLYAIRTLSHQSQISKVTFVTHNDDDDDGDGESVSSYI